MANETINGLTVQVRIFGSVLGSDGVRQIVDRSYEKSFTDGTGTNQCGAIWKDDDRSLASTSETLDLDALVDFKGAIMTDNNAVKVLFIQNNSTTTAQTVTVGGGDFSTPFADPTDKFVVGPGGIALFVNPIDGYAITAGTGDGLLVANNYTGTYNILLATDNA